MPSITSFFRGGTRSYDLNAPQNRKRNAFSSAENKKVKRPDIQSSAKRKTLAERMDSIRYFFSLNKRKFEKCDSTVEHHLKSFAQCFGEVLSSEEKKEPGSVRDEGMREFFKAVDDFTQAKSKKDRYLQGCKLSRLKPPGYQKSGMSEHDSQLLNSVIAKMHRVVDGAREDCEDAG